jgi:hypothetical protein
MEYRSEVCVVMKRDAFAEALKMIPNQVKELVGYANRFESEGDSILLYWGRIKWFSGETPVAQFMNFLSSRESEDYYFLELGEDLSLISDERGGYWENPFEASIRHCINVEEGKPIELSAFL